MKVACIIQSRTSSTRLPGKVLKHLPFSSDTTVLAQVIRRAKKIEGVYEVVVATTIEEDDDPIVRIGEQENVKVFRGSKNNVLERYFLAAKSVNADHIIRITSDCPCLDPLLVSDLLRLHLSEKAEYSSNSLIRALPHGMDAEVITMKALSDAYNFATELFEKEHVTPYIYKTNPHNFKIVNYSVPEKWKGNDIRITVDTEEDYALICSVYDYLYDKDKDFGISDIIELFNEKPWLKLINKSVRQKKLYSTLEEEKIDAVQLLEFQGLNRVANLFKSKF